MKHILFSVFDKKAEQYGRPFVARNHEEAKRSLSIEVNDGDPSSLLRRYPSDFSLNVVGVWDDGSGIIESSHPVFVVDLSDLVVPPIPEA